MRKGDETRNYLLEEIKHNYLDCNKHKKACNILNNIEQLLVLISDITGLVSISAFAFLVGIPIGIASSAVGLKTCAITYKSINKKKRKKTS